MNKMLKYTLIGLPFLLGFILLSSAIKTSPWIWYLTRAFGLLSFLALFATIALGELRLLAMPKGKFKLFKYHKPLAVYTLLLVLLHAIAAMFDKYKWGIGLKVTDYLGYHFSDKWLTLLSLGMLGFYLLILVGMTSMKPAMRNLGFKRWKLIHLLSYLSFVFAYIHTVNLGTDVKSSAISPIVHPAVQFSFWAIIALLVVRVLASFKIFTEQAEVTLTAAFFVVLIVGGIFVMSATLSLISDQPSTTNDADNMSAQITYYEQANTLLADQSKLIAANIAQQRGG